MTIYFNPKKKNRYPKLFNRLSMSRSLKSTEMRKCFSELQELVPTIPSNQKISETEILQHVINYIQDLELILLLSSKSISKNINNDQTYNDNQ